MKKVPMLIACSLLIFSCNKSNKEYEDQTSRISEVQGLQLMPNGAGSMMLINSGKQIVLLNKSADTLAENIFDRAVVLASETEFKDPTKRWQKIEGRVYTFADGRSVLIHAKGNKSYLLGLDEPLDLQRLNLISSTLGFPLNAITTVAGYGLSLMKGRWNVEKMLNRNFDNGFDMLNYGFFADGWYPERMVTKGPEPWAFKDPKCDSGGIGSESCTVKASNPIGGVECSVKCKTGFYACCENATTNCTCKKDPPTVN